tara:strand:+ start:15139 stop:15354 length:216 start_codon:yes stop_codon:yes gene_type:complete
MTRSRTLEQLAAKHPLITEYEYSPDDCGAHWLHLLHPYEANGNPSIHEHTVREVLAEVPSIAIPADYTLGE